MSFFKRFLLVAVAAALYVTLFSAINTWLLTTFPPTYWIVL